MPLNPVVLGAAHIADLGVSDPVVTVLMLAMPAPMLTWTMSNIQADATLGTPLIAAGAAIAGTGGFTAGSADALKSAIASAIGMTDPTGLEKMGIVTKHYADTITQYGIIDTTSLVAYAGPAPPTNGPVTGTGKIKLTKPFTFYTALSITDAPGIEKWTKWGDAIQLHLETFALITPAFTNPAAGGPVVGTGTIS